MMEHKYITCPQCSLWKDEDRRTRLCNRCNNSKQAIDPQEILCNMCGECMCPHEKTRYGTWSSDSPHGLVDATVVGGYESYHLFDTTSYIFSFCEKCLRQMFMQCKIKPVTSGLDYNDSLTREEAWEQDQKAYEYRLWCDAGGHRQAYRDRKCNAVKDCPNKAEYTIRVSGEFIEDCACEEHKNARNNCMNCTKVKFISNELKPFL